jgi:hypothetical protein
MSKTRSQTLTAKISNEDLRGEFFYRLNKDDPPTYDLWFMLRIEHEGGQDGTATRVKVSDHVDITAAKMGPGLVTLRDACLAQAGYV